MHQAGPLTSLRPTGLCKTRDKLRWTIFRQTKNNSKSKMSQMDGVEASHIESAPVELHVTPVQLDTSTEVSQPS